MNTRFSVIYRVKCNDKWFLFNRSVDLQKISSNLLKVLQVIGVDISSGVFSDIFTNNINYDTLQVIKYCYDLPNINSSDQAKLNQMKKEIAETLENTYYSIDSILDSASDKIIEERFADGFRVGLNRWLESIGSALYDYREKYKDLCEAYRKRTISTIETDYKTYKNHFYTKIKEMGGIMIRQNIPLPGTPSSFKDPEFGVIINAAGDIYSYTKYDL